MSNIYFMRHLFFLLAARKIDAVWYPCKYSTVENEVP